MLWVVEPKASIVKGHVMSLYIIICIMPRTRSTYSDYKTKKRMIDKLKTVLVGRLK